jgi:hypothetical protein
MPRSIQAEPLDSVIPAWSAGIQVDMDVSGGILATLDAGYPCRHDAEIHFHPLWTLRKIKNHSVVKIPVRLRDNRLYHSKASASRRRDLHELLIQLGHQYHELTVGLNFREEGASCRRWPRSEFS